MKFFAAATLLAAVASALPAFPLELREEKCAKPGRFISIVIDDSRSNTDTDPNNLRGSGAKDIISYLTTASKATADNHADKVAVTSFTTSANTLYFLDDPSGASRAVDRLQSYGGTAVYTGVQAGIQQIASAPANQGGMVVLTDGMDEEQGSVSQTLEQLRRAKDLGIRVSWCHLNHPKSGSSTIVKRGLISSFFDLFFGHNSGTGSSIGNSAALANGGTPLNTEISAAVLATGGTVSVVSDAHAEADFVKQVLKNGITNNDGKCSGLDINEGGGPIANNVTTMGLCSNTAVATYSYSPKAVKEKIAFTVALVSTANKVTLTAVYENKATGEKSTVTVNSGNPSQVLTGTASPSDQVSLSITPSGASSDVCQYSIRLDTLPDSIKPSNAPSSSASLSSAKPSSASPSSAKPSSASPSSAKPSSASPSSASPSSASPSSAKPSSASPSSAKPSSASPSSAKPSSASPSSASPSSASPSVKPTASSASPSVEPTPSASATTCADSPAQTIVTVTVTQTQTGNPSAVPTAEVCLCKCGTPGAVPFPKLEL